MDYTILFYYFIALVLIVVLTIVLAVKSPVIMLFGADSARRQADKNKILEYLKKHGKAQNHELREHVGCSAKTIVNYCDELEKESKIRQVGGIAPQTYYELVA